MSPVGRKKVESEPYREKGIKKNFETCELLRRSKTLSPKIYRGKSDFKTIPAAVTLSENL